MASIVTLDDLWLVQDIEHQTRSFLKCCERDRQQETFVVDRTANAGQIHVVCPCFDFWLQLCSKRSVKPLRWLRGRVYAEYRGRGIRCRSGFMFRNREGDCLEKSKIESGDVIYVSTIVRLNVSGMPVRAWWHEFVHVFVKKLESIHASCSGNPSIALSHFGQPLDSTLRLMSFGITEDSYVEAHFCQ